MVGAGGQSSVPQKDLHFYHTCPQMPLEVQPLSPGGIAISIFIFLSISISRES